MKKSWILPEKQMFRKFSSLQQLMFFDGDNLSRDFLNAVYEEKLLLLPSTVGSSSVDQSMSDTVSVETVRNFYCPVTELSAVEKMHQQLISPLYNKCFTAVEYECVKEMYLKIYPFVKITWLSRFYSEARKMVMNGEEYLSLKARSNRSAAILAGWPGNHGIDTDGNAPRSVG